MKVNAIKISGQNGMSVLLNRDEFIMHFRNRFNYLKGDEKTLAKLWITLQELTVETIEWNVPPYDKE